MRKSNSFAEANQPIVQKKTPRAVVPLKAVNAGDLKSGRDQKS
jgi:hypothetical protein